MKPEIFLHPIPQEDFDHTQYDHDVFSFYMTVNNINGKKYYGVHKEGRNKYYGSGLAIKNALKEYDKKNFTRYIIIIFHTQEEAYQFEEKHITPEMIKSNECYNMCGGGIGGYEGKKDTEETRKRKSKSHIGERNYMYGKTHTPEVRKILSEINKGENNYWYGRNHSLDTIHKMKKAQKGKNNGMYGKTHTLEARKKMSISQKGKNNGMYGKTHTLEARKKISAARKSSCVINGIMYDSIKSASELLNKHRTTIRTWIKTPNKLDCYYL
jgi:group I intron endonuclease